MVINLCLTLHMYDTIVDDYTHFSIRRSPDLFPEFPGHRSTSSNKETYVQNNNTRALPHTVWFLRGKADG